MSEGPCQTFKRYLLGGWTNVSGFMPRFVQVAAFAVLGILGSQPALPQHATGDFKPAICAEGAVDVAGASTDERRLVCSAAGEAIRLLGRCEISLLRPVRIEIVNAVHNPFGVEMLGRFDTYRETVVVTQYANVPSLVEGMPYREIPLDDFYRSLVVHEVVHSAMHQNYRRQPASRAAYEYPAYAFQLASLPADARDKLLRVIGYKSSKDDILFNDILLEFDPVFFAARAYEHFTTSQDGCANILALLQGEVAFVVSLPF